MKKLNSKQIVAVLCGVAIGLLLATNTQAQVKIGNNPNNINAGSILELESDSLGVLFPRVNIADLSTWAPLKGEPVEGMTVYNLEETTGKGFYLWDGVKWVKQSSAADGEWVYEGDSIVLKRSGTGDFKHKVYYKNNGQFISADTLENIQYTRYSNTDNVLSEVHETKSLSNFSNAKSLKFNLSTNVPDFSFRLHTAGNIYHEKALEYNYMNIIPADNIAEYGVYRGGTYSLYVTPDNTNDIHSVLANNGSSKLFGTGIVNYSIGFTGSVNVGNSQSVSTYISAVQGDNSIATSGSVNSVRALVGRNFYYSTSGANVNNSFSLRLSSNMPAFDNSLIQNYYGIYSELVNNSQNTGTGTEIMGFKNEVIQTGKIKYPNMYGIHTKTVVGASATKPTNLYGMYMADAIGATDANYAIYTNAGKVRFGDNVETTKNIKVGYDDSATPEFGMIRYNSTIGRMEAYVEDANGDGTKDDPGWRAM